MEASIRHFWVEIFCSGWYFCVKGKTLSLGMLHMSDDWVSGHSDNSENSGEIQAIAFMYRAKTISRNFGTWNCLEVTIPSSELSIFVIYPKNNLEFYFWVCNHACRGKFWVIIFFTILKTTTQNFSKPTKAFNLANIVQACPVSFQTHRVNKDVSNSIKDLDLLQVYFQKW